MLTFTEFMRDPRLIEERVSYGTQYCLKAKLRKSRAEINGKMYENVLVLATVAVDMKYRNRGEFRKFNEWMIKKATTGGYDFIYIEYVLDAWLERALIRYGYKYIENTMPLNPCMFMALSQDAKDAIDGRRTGQSSEQSYTGNHGNGASQTRKLRVSHRYGTQRV